MDHISKSSEKEAFISATNANETYKNKHKSKFIILLCLAQFGQFFNSQAMFTLQVPLQEELGITELNYSHLILAAALSGLCFPIINGLAVDYFGASKSFLASCILAVFGQALSIFACERRSFATLVVGKICLIGAMETGMLGRAKLNRLWHKDSELGRSFSVLVLFQTIAVILCDLLYPNLYQFSESLTLPFVLGAVFCVVSLLFSIAVVSMHTTMLSYEEGNVKSSQGNEKVSFRALTKLPALFWLILLAATLAIVSFQLSKFYLSKFLQVDYNYTVGQAGYFLALSQVLSGIASPIAGILVDKKGKLTIVLMFSVAMIQVGNALNCTLPKCDRCLLPVIPVIFYSIGYGPSFLAIQNGVAKIVKEKTLGLAMSMVHIAFSIEIATLSSLAGVVATATIESYGYLWIFVLNLGVGTLGLVFAIISTLR